MSGNANLIFLLFLNILAISALNQEGLSLLSWLSTFNSSHSATFFASWNATHNNPCKWDYIKCNCDGFVSEINISSIDLCTTFPIQFVSFNFLTTLVLSYGNLIGEIPCSIGNMSSLVSLDLSYNALTGRIPPEIGKLSQLQLLSLGSNFLEDGIPTEIGNLSKLQELLLFDNLLSGRIPLEIGQLRALEIFQAGGNPGICGEIPMQISQCKQLVFLEIPPILRWSRWRCRPMESANIRRQHPPSTAVAPPTEFHSSEGSVIGTLLALVIWLGAIHFNVLVVVSSFLLLPLSKFFAVLGLLVVLMLIPIDEKSRWGRKLASLRSQPSLWALRVLASNWAGSLSTFLFEMRLERGMNYLHENKPESIIHQGHETLQRINEAYVDDKSRPYKNIRIKHTYILDDPFDDPSQLSELIPDASPEGKPKDESQDDERE
ncbi:LRR receptor-like serine/threonine-protein kinase [Camellia lanceoleosa]|uniref:LRR receptor-like serine/threonine-protein kinase n=1 Tax=Camellia lanceoleosa TaxID=1840588 RepID=A0ACC0HLW4_9ERIC|nr:LRR receptor-like serine/threonine-protein kinase [Camellia lanceoleosa]